MPALARATQLNNRYLGLCQQRVEACNKCQHLFIYLLLLSASLDIINIIIRGNIIVLISNSMNKSIFMGLQLHFVSSIRFNATIGQAIWYAPPSDRCYRWIIFWRKTPYKLHNYSWVQVWTQLMLLGVILLTW